MSRTRLIIKLNYTFYFAVGFGYEYLVEDYIPELRVEKYIFIIQTEQLSTKICLEINVMAYRQVESS